MSTAHLRVRAFMSLLGLASALSPWPPRVISFWYAADNDWPALVEQIKPHLPLVTSVMTYCGIEVSDAGTVVGAIAPTCKALFPALAALNIRNEIILNSGNCSIDAYRALWDDHVNSPATLLSLALSVNASGVNIDLEPQANNCKGSGTGTAADAASFARWLHAVRGFLSPHDIRLTVDVAGWSPVLSQFATLSPSVDRLLDMQTYNGDSEAQWEGDYAPLRDVQPRDKAGLGLGAWSDAQSTPAWWETRVGADAKVAAAIRDGLPELALFRLVPTQKPLPWPLSFWWDAIAPFA